MLVERLAFDVLHHDGVQIALADQFVNLDDVAVTRGGSETRLVEEHAPALLVERESAGQDLDRHPAVEAGVLSLPNHAHPALADLLDEPIVGEHLIALSTHSLFRSLRKSISGVGEKRAAFPPRRLCP